MRRPSALSLLGTAPASDSTAVTAISGFAVVAANGYLNLRTTGSYSSSILTTVPNGAIVTVLTWGDTWSYIQYGTIVGYASSEYLTFSTSYPADIQEPDTGNGGTDGTTLSATVATQTGSLNMRQFPQAGSVIVTTIPNGATVSVTEKGDAWSAVTYSGMSGYVMTSFLSFANETEEPQDGDAKTQTLGHGFHAVRLAQPATVTAGRQRHFLHHPARECCHGSVQGQRVVPGDLRGDVPATL